jgi:hypothetical protein
MSERMPFHPMTKEVTKARPIKRRKKVRKPSVPAQPRHDKTVEFVADKLLTGEGVETYPTVEQIRTFGHEEMLRIRNDLYDQRKVLRDRRAMLANALQSVEANIAILDQTLRLIEASHGTGM